MLAVSALSSAYVLSAPNVATSPRAALRMQEEPGLLDAARQAYGIFQASKAEGMDFKQSVADALAGPYDRESATAEVQELAASAPLVLFTWE